MFLNGSFRHKADAGFTLIEVLVALSVIAVVLPAIGAVIATSVRASRGTEDRLVLAGIAETLLSGLSDRGTIQPGTRTGELSGHRWRIDISPMPLPPTPDGSGAASNWSPFAVAIRVESRGGYRVRVDTVRLASRSAG